MEILVFILLNYGISNIIVFGSIFEGFRDFWDRVNPNFFGKLFGCMMCTPFWVGVILSLTFNLMGYYDLSPMSNIGVELIPLAIFLDGCFGSGTTWLIHSFQEMLERVGE